VNRLSPELVGIALLAALVLSLTMCSKPAPTVKNADVLHDEMPRFHLWKKSDDADRSIQVKDRGGKVLGELVVKDNFVYAPKGSPLSHSTTTDDLYLIEPGLDIGTFAAYHAARGTDSMSVGIRLSPVRLLYGTVAPDLAIAQDWAGPGVSFYMPERLVGPTLSRVGVGAWYGLPYAGRESADPGWALGMSLSLRF
jgi:hypothetical protein